MANRKDYLITTVCTLCLLFVDMQRWEQNTMLGMARIDEP
jgi:hypothetical protein